MTTGFPGSAGRHSSRGLTLIELVVIVFLVGIVALIAAPSLHQTLLEYEADRAAVEVSTLVRYARSLSVGRSPHFVLFDIAANSVSVWNASTLDPAPDPARRGKDCILEFGVGGRFEHVTLVSVNFGGADRILFDCLGAAASAGTAVLGIGDFQRTIRVDGAGWKVGIDEIPAGH